MPARRDAYPARDADTGQRRTYTGPPRTSDRTARARLRHRPRHRGEHRTRYEVPMNPSSAKSRHRVTRADILPLDEYARVRRQRRSEISEIKKRRRVEIGPFATFYFENFDTMWQQVQEMLYIEKGGETQIEDELAAYNPLIPQGSELVATVMFEIDDAVRRANALTRLGGVESCMFLELAGERVRGE